LIRDLLRTAQGSADWDRLIVERRQAGGLERPETTLDQHYLLLWQGQPSVTERAYRPGQFVRQVKQPGTLSLGIAGTLPAVRAHSSFDVIACLIDPMAIERIADESDLQVARTLHGHLGFEDEALAQLMRLAAAEASAGHPNGRLYGDSISRAIVSRFLAVAGHRPIQDSPEASALAPHRLKRVLDLIASDFAQDLSLAALADPSGYSRAHFLRMFRNATGKSPLRYLQDHRLDMARRQLASRSGSITEVAQAMGFSSHSHLTRLFREKFGLTPSAFRLEQKVGTVNE
jgi:AraC family transcriptional regulator